MLMLRTSKARMMRMMRVGERMRMGRRYRRTTTGGSSHSETIEVTGQLCRCLVSVLGVRMRMRGW